MSEFGLHVVPLYIDTETKHAYSPSIARTRDFHWDINADDFVGNAVILGYDLSRRVVYPTALLAARGLEALQEMGMPAVQAMFSRMATHEFLQAERARVNVVSNVVATYGWQNIVPFACGMLVGFVFGIVNVRSLGQHDKRRAAVIIAGSTLGGLIWPLAGIVLFLGIAFAIHAVWEWANVVPERPKVTTLEEWNAAIAALPSEDEVIRSMPPGWVKDSKLAGWVWKGPGNP